MACYEFLLLSKTARCVSANKGRFLQHLHLQSPGPEHPALLLSNPAIRPSSSSYNLFPRRNHHHYTQPTQHHFRSLATMAATKEFALLCLENPLLGKFGLVVKPGDGERRGSNRKLI